MDDDPAKRFPSALAFVGALEAAGRGEFPPGPPIPLPAVPAVPAPVPAAPLSPVVVPTAGELEVEKELDPADATARTLFDPGVDDFDVRAREYEAEDTVAELGHAEGTTQRFADDFADQQAAAAESRRPLEAVRETVIPAAYASQPPMFGVRDPDPEIELRDDVDRARLRILPVALGVVVGLLIGFGIGHFVGSRNRSPEQQVASATAPAHQPATEPAGAATPQQPGTYSEQKVTPPAAPKQSATPPPIPNEGPATAAPSPRTPPAVTRGRLVVTSTPNGAGVTVNGNWRGRTPLTLDSLPFGRYILRLVLPGYQVAKHELTLTAGDTTQEVRARLERTPATRAATPAPTATPPRPPAKPAPADVFTGSLYVDSRPRGATVFLNGRSVGQTPLSLPEVPIGTHVVRLELTGKRTWATSTRVVAGETARVTGSLEDRPEEVEDARVAKVKAPHASEGLAPAAASEGRREPPRSGGPSAQRAWGTSKGPHASEGKR